MQGYLPLQFALVKAQGCVKHVYRRFHQVDAVIREVGILVKTYPTAFIDIPQALQVNFIFSVALCIVCTVRTYVLVPSVSKCHYNGQILIMMGS